VSVILGLRPERLLEVLCVNSCFCPLLPSHRHSFVPYTLMDWVLLGCQRLPCVASRNAFLDGTSTLYGPSGNSKGVRPSPPRATRTPFASSSLPGATLLFFFPLLYETGLCCI